ncbi:hypothetical protein [Streptomyces mirabilis]|uniref:hypothetical protein n=1 Tax=Streptomyces mirabilis TaxID=68239 RepID=UPI003331EBA6
MRSSIGRFQRSSSVRGIGEIGALFRNAAFADSMWGADEDNGSWHNVYSLLSFTPVEIPYTEIWDLPGFNAGDNFMGLRILDPEKAATVLDGLGIETQSEARDDDSLQEPVARALRTHTDIVDGEALRTPSTRYRLEERELVVPRTEAFLVQEYVGFLGVARPQRLRTPAGITDLHLTPCRTAARSWRPNAPAAVGSSGRPWHSCWTTPLPRL